MPANSPLGISFSPFDQQANGASQTGLSPSAPQQPIQVRNLRLPRVVGAGAPVAPQLLNAPGGASFGPAGGNLEQLLALLYGIRQPFQPGGGGTFNERPPQGDLGLGGLIGGWPQTWQPMSADSANAPEPSYMPLPWLRGLPPPKTTFNLPEQPGEGSANPPPATLTGANGEPYSPPSAGRLPWENSGPIARGNRFRY